MHNILPAAMRLVSEAAVRSSSFFSYDTVYRPTMFITNELVHWYFSMILIRKLS